MDKHKVTVLVAGKSYTLVSSEPEEYLSRVARYVDRQMTEVALATRAPSLNVAVMTSLNLCDELMQSQDECSRLRREIETLRHGQSEAET